MSNVDEGCWIRSDLSYTRRAFHNLDGAVGAGWKVKHPSVGILRFLQLHAEPSSSRDSNWCSRVWLIALWKQHLFFLPLYSYVVLTFPPCWSEIFLHREKLKKNEGREFEGDEGGNEELDDHSGDSRETMTEARLEERLSQQKGEWWRSNEGTEVPWKVQFNIFWEEKLERKETHARLLNKGASAKSSVKYHL